jgi:hypothetical protein
MDVARAVALGDKFGLSNITPDLTGGYTISGSLSDPVVRIQGMPGFKNITRGVDTIGQIVGNELYLGVNKVGSFSQFAGNTQLRTGLTGRINVSPFGKWYNVTSGLKTTTWG